MLQTYIITNSKKDLERKDKAFIKDILEVLYTAGIHEMPIQLEDTHENIANVALE